MLFEFSTLQNLYRLEKGLDSYLSVKRDASNLTFTWSSNAIKIGEAIWICTKMDNGKWTFKNFEHKTVFLSLGSGNTIQLMSEGTEWNLILTDPNSEQIITLHRNTALWNFNKRYLSIKQGTEADLAAESIQSPDEFKEKKRKWKYALATIPLDSKT